MIQALNVKFGAWLWGRSKENDLEWTADVEPCFLRNGRMFSCYEAMNKSSRMTTVLPSKEIFWLKVKASWFSLPEQKCYHYIEVINSQASDVSILIQFTRNFQLWENSQKWTCGKQCVSNRTWYATVLSLWLSSCETKLTFSYCSAASFGKPGSFSGFPLIDFNIVSVQFV